MLRSKVLRWLGVTLVVLGGVCQPAWAATRPVFTVSAASAFLRQAPAADAPRTYSVFMGQTFGVTGRTADAAWLRLDFAGGTQGTWVLASLGTVKGDLASIPVVTPATTGPGQATLTPALAAPAATRPPVVPDENGNINTTFTITVKSVFGRSAPDPVAVRVQSLFQGQTYPVRAQSASGQWLLVEVTGATTEVWVPLGAGTLKGNPGVVPLETPAAVATPAPAATQALPPAIGPTDYPITPTVSARAREIYQRGLALGNNPHAFSKIGDCQNVVAFFLANFDKPGQYRLGPDYAYLQSTIDQFHGSFGRPSEAVRGGFNVASVLDPLWTNPKNCKPKETPLDCEFRINRPSLVFVSMETWWAGAPAADYEQSLRKIVEYAIGHGALPILATKADNLEKDGGLNAAVVRVAQDYDVPLWNFWLAVQPLPDRGLLKDGFHLTIGHKGQFIFDDPENMRGAWPWRNLTALMALEAVWHGVK